MRKGRENNLRPKEYPMNEREKYKMDNLVNDVDEGIR